MERLERGSIDVMQDEPNYLLLSEAEGMIEAKEHQQERLDEITRRVASGEFHVPTELLLPCGCIDGRCGCTLKPNAAGGTETLMVADDLTNKQFAANSGSTAGAYENIVAFLKKNGIQIGGHDDAGANNEKSGCGANDKLAEIYDMISRKADVLHGYAEAIGLEISDETHEVIKANAAGRTEFSSGPEICSILDRETGGDYDHLHGEHNEVVAVINLRNGTTLDRDALEAEFGPEYEAFNIDAWSFENAANYISTTDNSVEAKRKQVAMAYYNFATALTLCGPNMRIIVLD